MSTLAVNTINPATGSSVAINSYVPPAQFAWRNRIINGDMTIAQRGTSFVSPSSNAYSIDRWKIVYTASAAVTLSQQSDAPSNNEFQNSLRAAVTTADTSIAAGDWLILRQDIEGYNARDLIGRTFTLSFWVRSSKTGAHCAAFVNSANDRSYVVEYTVSSANVWEFKSITVSSGLITAGTWDWTNGVGLKVCFTLACGTTFQTTAGAWQTGNFLATSSQVNCLDTVGNIFAITGVQLEAGSVATPFEHRPYGAELALCQRYARWQAFNINFNPGASAGSLEVPVSWHEMRVSPTAAALTADPNVSQAAINNATNLFQRLTPYGGCATLTSSGGGTSYVVGYRSLLTAEL